jgi:hypothetical protein
MEVFVPTDVLLRGEIFRVCRTVPSPDAGNLLPVNAADDDCMVEAKEGDFGDLGILTL